jgi:hypothetical protein
MPQFAIRPKLFLRVDPIFQQPRMAAQYGAACLYLSRSGAVVAGLRVDQAGYRPIDHDRRSRHCPLELPAIADRPLTRALSQSGDEMNETVAKGPHKPEILEITSRIFTTITWKELASRIQALEDALAKQRQVNEELLSWALESRYVPSKLLAVLRDALK